MLSLPPSMAGVPAEAQPTAPRMSGAKGAAMTAEGDAQAGGAQTGFEAELMAAGQAAQVRETPSRRSDNGQPGGAQPGDTGQRTGEATASQTAPQDADPELDPAAIAAETGAGAQASSQITAQITAQIAARQGEGQTIQNVPNAANDAGGQDAAPPGGKSGAKSDAGAKSAADPAQTPNQAPNQAADQTKGQAPSPDPKLNAGPQGAQPRPDDAQIQAPGTGASAEPDAVPDAKPRAEAKSDDAKTAAGAQAVAASAKPAGPEAAREASQATTQAEPRKAPQQSSDANTAAPASQDMRKQDAKTAGEPSAQGLSGLKSDAKAGPDTRADAPAAQRVAFGQSGKDTVRREGGGQASSTAAEARPTASAPASAGPVPAASRPLAELIAMQLQPLAQGAPLAPDGQAVSLDPLLSGDAEGAMDPAQMRAEARTEAMRTPGQAGQAARFTPHTVQHLAARVAQTAADGGRTFDIRLDPAELGRVRVRLEMGADNSVRAVLSAERADTLAELQRSSRDLVKALEDAGLDLADNGLEFSLSQGGQDEQGGFGGYTPVFVDTEIMTGEAAASSAQPGPATLYGFALHARARLDVRI